MTSKKIANFLILCFVALFFTALFYSCAQVGTITGGEKDTVAPVLKKSKPEIYSSNFDGKKVKIRFDEFYSLDNIEQKFLMSPSQDSLKPKIKVKGKWLKVKFKEKLKDDTTYTLQFFDAVKDFNEGNKIDNFSFVFSTGRVTDSCAVSGQIFDAQTLEKQKDMLVGLYGEQTNFLDSVPLKIKPDYITRTDTAGKFKIDNVKSGRYKIFALCDINETQKFDLENEKIAFLKSIFVTKAERVKKIDSLIAGTILHLGEKGHRILDTLLSDTVIIQDLLYTTPNNLKLYSFEEVHLVQYITERTRDMRCRVKLNFNKTVGKDSVIITYVDDTLKSPKMIYDYNKNRDSLILWFTDTTDIKNDTLELRVTFSTLDSLKRPTTETDTISVKYKVKKPSNDKKNSSKTVDTGIDSLNFKIKTNFNGDFDILGNIKLDIPIVFNKIDTSLLKLYEIKDSSFVEDRNNKIVKALRLDSANYRVIFKRPILGDIAFYPTDSIVRKDWYSAVYSQNRDTVDILVTDSVMKHRSKFPNILKYRSEYYLGQVQKIRDSVPTNVADQKIIKYSRPCRDSVKILFEKTPARGLEISAINVDKVPQEAFEIISEKENIVVLLKDTALLKKDTLALRINSFDRQVFNKNKKLVDKFFRDTLFLIYKIPFQKLISNDLIGEDTLQFVFSKPLTLMPEVRLIDYPDKNIAWYSGMLTQKKDTFVVVSNDLVFRNLDTIKYSIAYNSINKQEMDTLIVDTLKMVRKKEELEKDSDKGNRRRKSEAGRAQRQQNEEQKKNMVPASLKFEQPYVMEVDSMNSKNRIIKSEFEPGKQYVLEIDDSTFISVYGTPNLFLSGKAKIRELDYYGTMKINLSNVGNVEHFPDIDEDLPPFEEIDTARMLRRKINPKDTMPVSFPSINQGQLMVCLCNDKGEIKYSKFLKEDGQVLFDFILPAEYKVKIIWDKNSNGKWDTGKYLEGLYPEKVLEFPKKQTVKSKWETILDWKL